MRETPLQKVPTQLNLHHLFARYLETNFVEVSAQLADAGHILMMGRTGQSRARGQLRSYLRNLRSRADVDQTKLIGSLWPDMARLRIELASDHARAAADSSLDPAQVTIVDQWLNRFWAAQGPGLETMEIEEDDRDDFEPSNLPTPLNGARGDATFLLEQERQRLRRELHDGLASDLATASALLRYYFQQEQLPKADREEILAGAQQVIDDLLHNCRRILRGLRTRSFGPEGLVSGLRRLGDQIQSLYQITVSVQVEGDEEQLTLESRETIFHVVREALANVRQHSGATRCEIRLNFAASPFSVEIADDGRGFQWPSESQGYGLRTMRERAEAVSGSLEVVSSVGRGTTVYVFGAASSP